jgi:hypothetical protein
VRDAELHKYGDGGDPKLLIADIDVMTEAECEALRGDKGNPWGPAKKRLTGGWGYGRVGVKETA